MALNIDRELSLNVRIPLWIKQDASLQEIMLHVYFRTLKKGANIWLMPYEKYIILVYTSWEHV